MYVKRVLQDGIDSATSTTDSIAIYEAYLEQLDNLETSLRTVHREWEEYFDGLTSSSYSVPLEASSGRIGRPRFDVRQD